MKKTTKIFTALFLALNVIPVFGAGSGPNSLRSEISEQIKKITVEGKVIKYDETPVEFATVSVVYENGNPIPGIELETTNKNGQFTFQNVPDDAYIKATLNGAYSEKLPVKPNMIIQITSNQIDEVIIQDDTGKNDDTGGDLEELDLSGTAKIICNDNIETRWKFGKCVCKDSSKELINGKCVTKNVVSKTEPELKPKKVDPEEMAKKQKAYDEAKANEQSMANRTLTAATTAATGIGGMELAQGLSEQRADKTAEQSMSNYIATMRCKYGDTQVKAGLEEIELPGGNDSEMAKYRTEYFALAADLRERKTALGMAAGIESEEILDKSEMGLYDDENIGISDGAYASIYRAQMYNSESDKAKINEAKEASENRVTIGATAAGIGVVGGVIGDRLINNEATERIARAGKNSKAVENTALNKLKSCLTQAKVKKTDELQFKEFQASALDLSNIDCEKDLTKAAGKNAQDLFEDSKDGTKVCAKLEDSFGDDAANEMLGCPFTPADNNIPGNNSGVDMITLPQNMV